MAARYLMERLPNGLVRVYDRQARSSGCWNADGTAAHGDLTRGRDEQGIGQMVREMPAAMDECTFEVAYYQAGPGVTGYVLAWS